MLMRENRPVHRKDLFSSRDDLVIRRLARLQAYESAAQIAEHLAVIRVTRHSHLPSRQPATRGSGMHNDTYQLPGRLQELQITEREYAGRSTAFVLLGENSQRCTITYWIKREPL